MLFLDTSLHILIRTYINEFYQKFNEMCAFYLDKNYAYNENDNSRDPDKAQDQWFSFFQNQMNNVKKLPENKGIYIVLGKMHYAWIAWIDELWIQTNWRGKSFWIKNLLEKKILATHNAGDKIFDKIEEDLNDYESNHEISKYVIGVYIDILTNGFLGRYRYNEQDRNTAITKIHNRLYYKYYGRTIESWDQNTDTTSFLSGKIITQLSSTDTNYQTKTKKYLFQNTYDYFKNISILFIFFLFILCSISIDLVLMLLKTYDLKFFLLQDAIII